jgi:N-acylglucosamine 2-epimerase
LKEVSAAAKDNMSTTTSELICNLRKQYLETLENDIMPFWLRHSYYSEFGGINNILDVDGRVLGNDKYLWSQGRALWTFSALCRRLEPRPEWRRFADHLFEYLSTQGRDEDGRWVYRLDKEGRVLDGDISIYVDGFVMNGMAEYYSLTGNKDALKIALETQENVARRLRSSGSYLTAPYKIPDGMKTLGVAMIFSFFFYELGEIAENQDIKDQGVRLAKEILSDFVSPSQGVLHELVSCSGEKINTPEGNVCIPGHAIEALWFAITIFERTGDNGLIQRCCELILRHIEFGWDKEYGGIFLALDIQNRPDVAWANAQYKPWWVQIEALVATAYAYLHTQNPSFLDWHLKIQAWCWEHYPHPDGEWYHWLDRFGNPSQGAPLPVKDPFHLPRALLYLNSLCERIESELSNTTQNSNSVTSS